MTPDLWIAIINFAIKFGIDATIAIVNGVKSGKTIDDAIAALEVAKTKSADDYLKEARGGGVVQPPPGPGSPVPPGAIP